MDAKKFLETKGVFSLDTKKRYKEVLSWMEEYSRLNKIPPRKDWLMDVIDNVVDEHQTLSSSHIANGIIDKWKDL